MPELAEVSLRLWKLRFTAELAWGDDDDDDPPEPALFHHLAALDMPEIELEDEDDDEPEERGLGFT